LIKDVQSNGIHLSYAQNTTISGNTLQHNHYVAIFDTCGGPCPGGQIDMLNNTSLLIYSNQIIDGQIDLNNTIGQTDGIEIANQNTNVMIRNNIIANNLGAAIGVDSGSTGTNFVISGNKCTATAQTFTGCPAQGFRKRAIASRSRLGRTRFGVGPKCFSQHTSRICRCNLPEGVVWNLN
jgi:hypothetical protein